MSSLTFTKMHGLGNCFVMMDDRDRRVSQRVDPVELAVMCCDRNFGIGADGLILVREHDTCDLEMQIVNEDGSMAEMCGNGVRCFARYAVEEAITSKRSLTVFTPAGVIQTKLLDDGNVEVDMGPAKLETDDVIGEPAAAGHIQVIERDKIFTFVSMGNPHAVTFVDDLDFDWRSEGRAVETASAFPNKANVEFVRILNEREAEVKVWERGCGETQACGTGACAVAVAGVLNKRLDRAPVNIHLPGGPLLIQWNEENRVMMTGPTTNVCKGEYLLEYSQRSRPHRL